VHYEIKKNFSLKESKPLILTTFEQKKDYENLTPFLLNGFVWNNEIFVYNFTSQLAKLEKNDIILALPKNKKELFEILSSIFVLQNQKGEHDIILFLKTLISFDFEQKEAVEKVLNLVGKKAGKQKIFMNGFCNKKIQHLNYLWNEVFLLEFYLI